MIPFFVVLADEAVVPTVFVILTGAFTLIGFLSSALNVGGVVTTFSITAAAVAVAVVGLLDLSLSRYRLYFYFIVRHNLINQINS